jgi:hypothetical protein
MKRKGGNKRWVKVGRGEKRRNMMVWYSKADEEGWAISLGCG